MKQQKFNRKDTAVAAESAPRRKRSTPTAWSRSSRAGCCLWRTEQRWERSSASSSTATPCASRKSLWGASASGNRCVASSFWSVAWFVGWAGDWLVICWLIRLVSRLMVVGWSVGWWLAGRLVSLVGRLVWLVGWLDGWLIVWVMDWLVWLVWLVGWLVGWMVWLVWLVGWLVGWLIGWLVDWLVWWIVWSVSWLTDWFVRSWLVCFWFCYLQHFWVNPIGFDVFCCDDQSLLVFPATSTLFRFSDTGGPTTWIVTTLFRITSSAFLLSALSEGVMEERSGRRWVVISPTRTRVTPFALCEIVLVFRNQRAGGMDCVCIHFA